MESGNYCLKYINDIESFGFNRNKKIDLNSLIYKDIMRRRYMESKYGSYNNNNKVLFEKYKSFEKNKLGIETNFKRVMKKKYIIKFDDDEYPQNKTYFREKSQEKGEEKTHKVVNNLKINKKGKDSFSKLIESIKKKLEKNKKNGNRKKNNPNNNSYSFNNKNNSKTNINNNSNICSNDKINIVLVPITHQNNYNVFNRKEDFFNQRNLKILYEKFFNSKSNLELFRKNNSYLNYTNNIKILININKIKLIEFEKLKKLIKSYINNKRIFAFEKYKCNI